MTQGLKDYLENAFKLNSEENNTLPLESEDQNAYWKDYIKIYKTHGFIDGFKDTFRQFHFPIQSGIKDHENYKKVTAKGIHPKDIDLSPTLKLDDPSGINAYMHQCPAGEIPVIHVPNRIDFENIIRCIVYKNEPAEFSKAMGAIMIAGFNNWNRIDDLKNKWEINKVKQFPSWGMEFKFNVVPNKTLYKDRFIILSNGPYSNVKASSLGLEDEEWINYSLIIRREHECTHYFTKRFFGTMRNNMHDELLADYMGISMAKGIFISNWFLTFLGLEGKTYRKGGRIENYLKDPVINDQEFISLQEIMRKASINTETFDEELGSTKDYNERTLRLLALSQVSLDKIASANAVKHLIENYKLFKKKISFKNLN